MSKITNYYLCGIGTYGNVENYKVGLYDVDRETFKFHNGSYSPTELGKKPLGSNAYYVITYVSLEDIDNAGLLDLNQKEKQDGK